MVRPVCDLLHQKHNLAMPRTILPIATFRRRPLTITVFHGSCNGDHSSGGLAAGAVAISRGNGAPQRRSFQTAAEAHHTRDIGAAAGDVQNHRAATTGFHAQEARRQMSQILEGKRFWNETRSFCRSPDKSDTGRDNHDKSSK